MSAGSVIVNQPGVYFVDADGNVITAADGSAITNQEALLVAGKDGSVMRFVRVAADGTVRTDPTGTTTQPVSAVSLPLPAGAATETTVAAINTATGTTADADTANTVIGRLKQLVTKLAGGLPAALVGGRLDNNIGAWLGSTVPTVGSKTSANSIPTVIASDQAPVALKLQDVTHNLPAAFTSFGTLKMASETTLANLRLDDTSIAQEWNVLAANGGGVASVRNGTGAVLSSGAAMNGSVVMRTKLTYRYHAGRGQMVKFSTINEAGVAGNTREWGYATETSGLFFRLSGTTLSFVRKNAGVEVVTLASAWDIPTTHDIYGHIWYIQFHWLGVGDIFLYRDGVLVHTIHLVGALTEFSLLTPDLPVYLSNVNTTNATNIRMSVGCVEVVTEGGIAIQGVDNLGTARDINVDMYGSLAARMGRDGIYAQVDSDGSNELAVRDDQLLGVALLMLNELRAIRFQLGHATEVMQDEVEGT